MFSKLAYSQKVLRALVESEEKNAGVQGALVTGALLTAGAQTARKGIQKAKEYKAGFQPGVAETRVE